MCVIAFLFPEPRGVARRDKSTEEPKVEGAPSKVDKCRLGRKYTPLNHMHVLFLLLHTSTILQIYVQFSILTMFKQRVATTNHKMGRHHRGRGHHTPHHYGLLVLCFLEDDLVPPTLPSLFRLSCTLLAILLPLTSIWCCFLKELK